MRALAGAESRRAVDALVPCRSLTTSALYIVRSGARAFLRRMANYPLFQWPDYEIPVEIICNCYLFVA